MYNDISEKIKEGVFPFHQKVLRFNYDIPVESLKRALEIVFEHFDSQQLCIASDFFEYSNQTVLSYQMMPLKDFYNRLETCGLKDEMVKTGVFDPNISYYIRLYIENEKEISQGLLQSGNFELYTKDNDIQVIYDKIHEEIPAHLLLDGAKKYLDEIFFY